MQIVELGDCSMVIMKDSEDPPWVSVGDVYRDALKYKNGVILVEKRGNEDIFQAASDYIYTAGRLVLFFKEQINSEFHLYDKVGFHTLTTEDPENINSYNNN